MNKINKCKQNNHNARTVTPIAKTETIQMLTISNVSSDILEAIDAIAARQDRSRSSFVRRELQRIVAEYRATEALEVSRDHGDVRKSDEQRWHL